jgi:hypothetical protein
VVQRPARAGLLHGLSIATEALSRVTTFIVRLMPVGLFAIVASAAGTMSFQEFGRLHVFLLPSHRRKEFRSVADLRERNYDYWILGRGAVKKAPRWSVMRDVLHWVE